MGQDAVLLGWYDNDILISSPDEEFTVNEQNQVTIVKGEDKELRVRIVNNDWTPFDLTGYSLILARFKKSDNTALAKSSESEIGLEVALEGSPVLGRLVIHLTDTDTASLKSDPEASMELWIDKDDDRTIIQFRKALRIVDRLI